MDEIEPLAAGAAKAGAETRAGAAAKPSAATHVALQQGLRRVTAFPEEARDERVAAFQQDLDDIIHELATLAALCGLRLRDPGVMDAVLRNDPHLRHGHEAAFDKMRGLLVLAFATVEQAVAVEGVGPTSAFILRALTEIDERRGLRG